MKLQVCFPYLLIDVISMKKGDIMGLQFGDKLKELRNERKWLVSRKII